MDGAQENKVKAVKDNAVLPYHLALACRAADKKLVHFSTGCIFSGHVDSHTLPNADTMYAKTKIMGENMISLVHKDSLIVRLRLPFGITEHPRELITKMLKMTRFHNVQNSITCVDDLLWATYHLVKTDSVGVYNIVNHGTVSLLDIATMISDVTPFVFEEVDFDSIKTPIKRVNVTMDTSDLKKLGIPMPDVKESLRKVLNARFAV